MSSFGSAQSAIFSFNIDRLPYHVQGLLENPCFQRLAQKKELRNKLTSLKFFEGLNFYSAMLLQEPDICSWIERGVLDLKVVLSIDLLGYQILIDPFVRDLLKKDEASVQNIITCRSYALFDALQSAQVEKWLSIGGLSFSEMLSLPEEALRALCDPAVAVWIKHRQIALQDIVSPVKPGASFFRDEKMRRWIQGADVDPCIFLALTPDQIQNLSLLTVQTWIERCGSFNADFFQKVLKLNSEQVRLLGNPQVNSLFLSRFISMEQLLSASSEVVDLFLQPQICQDIHDKKVSVEQVFKQGADREEAKALAQAIAESSFDDPWHDCLVDCNLSDLKEALLTQEEWANLLGPLEEAKGSGHGTPMSLTSPQCAVPPVPLISLLSPTDIQIKQLIASGHLSPDQARSLTPINRECLTHPVLFEAIQGGQVSVRDALSELGVKYLEMLKDEGVLALLKAKKIRPLDIYQMRFVKGESESSLLLDKSIQRCLSLGLLGIWDIQSYQNSVLFRNASFVALILKGVVKISDLKYKYKCFIEIMTSPLIQSFLREKPILISDLRRITDSMWEMMNRKPCTTFVDKGVFTFSQLLSFTENTICLLSNQKALDLLKTFKLSIEDSVDLPEHVKACLCSQGIRQLFKMKKITWPILQDMTHETAKVLLVPLVQAKIKDGSLTVNQLLLLSALERSAFLSPHICKMIRDGELRLNQILGIRPHMANLLASEPFNKWRKTSVVGQSMSLESWLAVEPDLSAVLRMHGVRELLDRGVLTWARLSDHRTNTNALIALRGQNGRNAGTAICNLIGKTKRLTIDQLFGLSLGGAQALCRSGPRGDFVSGRLTYAALNALAPIPDYVMAAVQEQALNAAQSTHTSSVHKSVSLSASRLKDRYGAKVSAEGVYRIIAAVQREILELPETEVSKQLIGINQAAKRCIIRLVEVTELAQFLDKPSSVRLFELIAFIWTGIADEDNRLGSVEDAKKAFVSGLYEIQRGYNINLRNVDTGGADKHICAGGTFNKFIQAMAGVLRDCELIFITKQTATLKFTALVIEEAFNFLNEFPLNSRDAIEEFRGLLSEIEEDARAVGPVWGKISDKVSASMLEQFSTIYKADAKDSEFHGLMAAAEYLCFKEEQLDCLKKRLQAPDRSGVVTAEAAAVSAGPAVSEKSAEADLMSTSCPFFSGFEGCDRSFGLGQGDATIEGFQVRYREHQQRFGGSADAFAVRLADGDDLTWNEILRAAAEDFQGVRKVLSQRPFEIMEGDDYMSILRASAPKRQRFDHEEHYG